ncbi:MAG TPA: hypothetical protein VK468_05575, partial [Pyrinomonadaceae bacterium]|nr:hypothetical protein [Pyrinomonadaceae bacterium]
SKVEAASREEKIGYLRPYDVFEYLPRPADFLSVTRTRDIDKSRLSRGMLLQTCSGRNLGPAVFVDEYLAQFAVGGDMIRIEIDDPDLRAYALAYMQSETGQQLLTQGKTGSVIDHLSKAHIAKLEIPLLEHSVRSRIVSKMSEAIRLREEARLTLDKALSEFERSLPSIKRSKPEKHGWTVRAKNLSGRLDAASYDPLVASVRKQLQSKGGVSVQTVATVLKPAGRYKTVYVGKEHGRPILSGTQLLQSRPINLRFMPEGAFKMPEAYRLRKNWIAYQADGRVEDALGLPIMITADRDGWLASGHVGRVIGNDDVDAGWLYLAIRSWPGQIQLKSLASGSVVDSTFPWDMEGVILPPETNGVSKLVPPMWDNFALAQRLEDEAIGLIERSLSESGSPDLPVRLISPPSDVELEFRELVEKWRKDTQHTSSVKKMVEHPSYKRIIQMGETVLEHLFKELNASRDHWLVALNAITGEDPVPEDSNYSDAVDAWLAWGRGKGYLSKRVN